MRHLPRAGAGLMVDGLRLAQRVLSIGAIVWLRALVSVDESQDPRPTQLDWVGWLTRLSRPSP